MNRAEFYKVVGGTMMKVLGYCMLGFCVLMWLAEVLWAHASYFTFVLFSKF